MAFDADRGLTFIPVIESGNVLLETSDRRAGLVEGQFTTPAFVPEAYDPAAMLRLYGALPPLAQLARGIKTNTASRGFLRAWNVAQHRTVWEVPTATSWDGGVLATAGGLVFQGDANGNLNAYSADTGERLASVAVGSSMMAAPITYRVNGTQYIAIVAGYGGGAVITGAPLDPASAAYRYGNDGRIIVLKIGGPPPPLPPLVAEQPLPMPPAAARRHGADRCGRSTVQPVLLALPCVWPRHSAGPAPHAAGYPRDFQRHRAGRRLCAEGHGAIRRRADAGRRRGRARLSHRSGVADASCAMTGSILQPPALQPLPGRQRRQTAQHFAHALGHGDGQRQFAADAERLPE